MQSDNRRLYQFTTREMQLIAYLTKEKMEGTNGLNGRETVAFLS